MKYVVTGGAGFIGSHIAEYLVDHGHDVTVIDNLFSGKKENIQHLLDRPNFRFVQGSITSPDVLKKVCRGADGIFHQAAIPSVPRSICDPAATNEANVNGTLNVLVTARNLSVRKVVYVSSSSVYRNKPTLPEVEGMTPNPKSPYAVSKLAGEGMHRYGCLTSNFLNGL